MALIDDMKKSFFDERQMRKTENSIATQVALTKAPILSELISKKFSLWVECLKGALPEEKCIKETDAIERELKKTLRKNGFSPDIFEYKPICSDCNDTGYVKSVMCSCLKNHISSCLNLTSPRLHAENFGTFDLSIFSSEKKANGKSCRDQMADVRSVMELYIKEFGSKRQNFLFIGPVGAGKSFMANCVAYSLISLGKSVVTVTANRLTVSMNENIYGKSNSEEINMIYSCDLLIIDDMGSEQINDYSGNLIFNIVNDRMLDRKDMIISSNLSLKELNERYAQRLISRLTSSFQGVHFPQNDIRKNTRKRFSMPDTTDQQS